MPSPCAAGCWRATAARSRSPASTTEVRQNPLHRLFGVAELRLESAGGVRPEAEMRVLRLDQALALERLVRQRGQAPQPADVVATPSITGTDTEQVLLRLSSWDVVRMGPLQPRMGTGDRRLRRVVPDRRGR